MRTEFACGDAHEQWRTMIVLFVPWPKTDEHVALRTLRPFALSPSFPSDQVGEFLRMSGMRVVSAQVHNQATLFGDLEWDGIEIAHLPLEYGARQGQPAAHACVAVIVSEHMHGNEVARCRTCTILSRKITVLDHTRAQQSLESTPIGSAATHGLSTRYGRSWRRSRSACDEFCTL